MENPTGFDLNAAIQTWRASLSSSPRLRSENLGELESHLRDSVDFLRNKGLSEEEAYLVATHRMGSLSALEQEFAKVNRKELWLDRLFWMLAGVLVIRFVFSFSIVATDAVLWAGLLGSGFHPDVKTAVPLGVLFGLIQLAFLVFGAFACVRLWKRSFGHLHRFAGRVAQSGVRMGMAIVAISLAFLSTSFGLGWVEAVWRLNYFPREVSGALMYSRHIANAISSPIETIAIVGGAVLLFRYQVRRGVNA